MVTGSDPFFNFQNRQSESYNERIKRFLRTQPLLAVLMGQAITTYILLHSSFLYGLFFVLLLYFGGVFLRQYFSDLVLTAVYLAGGIAGHLTYGLMFSSPLFHPGITHLAATQGSAVVALLSFTAVAKPDLRLRVFLLMTVRFWLIVAGLIIFDLLLKDITGGGTHLSHLGGLLVASLIALVFFRKVLGTPMQNLRFQLKKRRNRKFEKYETVKESGRPLQDDVYNDIRAERQKKVDEILDKISKSGYDSLTKEEKELLFRQSGNHS
jgi:membrane associated rhomboid family serine protease